MIADAIVPNHIKIMKTLNFKGLTCFIETHERERCVVQCMTQGSRVYAF